MSKFRLISNLVMIGPLITLLFLAPAKANDIFPDYMSFSLDNGLQAILTIDSRLPLADFALVIKAGSASDSARTSGLAILTAEMLRMGTANYSRDDLAEAMDILGGQGDLAVRRDYTELTGNLLAQDLDKGLALLAEVVMRPTLDEADLNVLKRRYISNRIQGSMVNETLAAEIIFGRYFGNSGYGLPVEGNISGLENLTIEDIREFFGKNYRPNNAALIVAGDFDEKAIRKTIEKLFSQWQPGENFSAPIVQLTMPDSLEILLVDKPEAPSTYFLIGRPTVAIDSKELLALALFNYSFGAGGEISHLYQYLVRERGLVHDIRSDLAGTRWHNMFTITGLTDHNLAAAAVDEVIKVLKEDIMLRMPAAELAAAKHFYKGVLYQSVENTTGLTEVMSGLVGLQMGHDYYENISQILDGIDPAFVRKNTSAYLNPDQMTVVIVGPESKIKRDLMELAPVQVLDVGND